RAIFGRKTVSTAIFEILSQCNIGPPFWSHDQRYHHISFGGHLLFGTTQNCTVYTGLNPLKSTLPVQGYGGFYWELLLKLSQFLSERHRNYTPRNLEPFSFQIYTV